MTRQMIRPIAMISSALMLAAGIAVAQSADRMGTDSQFVTKAGQGGMAEVELGRLAQKQASNEKVKQFGQKMVDDHSKANEELSSIAAKQGVTLPTELNSTDQALKEKLSGLSGRDFDLAYMQDMVKDHREDVNEFRKEASIGRDPEVKAFASKTLPTLREHLRMAEQTLADLKK